MVGAAIGIASTLLTTGMSFAQANKQKQLQKQAEQEADKAMFAARKRLEVNYMDALSVQKEPYELAREKMLAQGTQATNAAQEGETRGVATTAGKVQMGQNEAQGDIRTEMGKELTEIERLKVAEDARLRDLNTQLDLGEVEGAQMAAANAQEMSAAAMEQGFEGVTSAATQAANLIPLYGSNTLRKSGLSKMSFTPEELQKFGYVLPGTTLGPNQSGTNEGGSNLDFEKIQAMSNSEFRDFRNALRPEQKDQLMTNKNYINPFKF